MGVDVPMDITGVRMELPSNTPIILLREQGGERFLPIWIGPVEAMAISAAIDGVAPPRPQTHDLLTSVIDGLGAAVSRVVVTELRDNVFFADLVLEIGGREVVVSARPSDAVALAVRTGSPVFARTDVLDEAGIERFREALEDMTVEDFLGEDLE
jgi:bifunctional DNase/RNase